MRSMRELLVLAGVASGVWLAFAACSDDRGFTAPPNLFTGQDSAPPDACVDTMRCSPDLKQVLKHHCDGTEEVVTTCNPDQGCGNATCVDACQSAAISKGSIGCSFSTLPPDSTVDSSAGDCFAAMIANTWDRPVNVTATYGKDPLDITASMYYPDQAADGTISYTLVKGAIDPGKVAIVFLAAQLSSVPAGPEHINCPANTVPAVNDDPIAHKTARTKAFGLLMDTPVSAYSIWPYGGALSYLPAATVLLPRSSWDTHYVAVSGWSISTPGIPSSPFLQIVSAEDNTTVKMKPNVDIVDGNNVVGIDKGQTQTWTLGAGEVIQITQPDDTSGSPIESDKPIGIFGGAECPFLPSQYGACDSLQQQIAPVSQWGSEYAMVPYRPRIGAGEGTIDARENVPWRFVGASDGTVLTYDPATPVGAPTTLAAGQVVTFMTSDITSVHSQDGNHPFYVGVFMTGAQYVSDNSGAGDPDYVNIVPSDQFLDRYIFFTDYTFPDTTLTFVRRKTANGFAPVTLDCVGEVPDFKPLGTSGQYEFAWLKLTAGGVGQSFDGGAACGYGRHEVSSTGDFSVYVWGMGYDASYGYPGGMGSRPLSNITGPPVN